MVPHELSTLPRLRAMQPVKAERTGGLTAAIFKQNALLTALTPDEAANAVERGRLVELTTPEQIYEAGREIHEVFFPIDSVLSVVTQMRDGGSIEVGTVGREGVSAG